MAATSYGTEYLFRYDVYDTVRHTRLGDLLGRLEHQAVASGESGPQLPQHNNEAEIPGDDLAHDSDRLALHLSCRYQAGDGAGDVLDRYLRVDTVQGRKDPSAAAWTSAGRLICSSALPSRQSAY
jgi:hypothetical protein